MFDRRDKRLAVPEELVRTCVRMTETRWTQGESQERLEDAFRRILRTPLPPTMLVAAIEHEGKLCTAHVVQGGIVLLWDPVRRWQIRTLTKEGERAKDRAANISDALAKQGRASAPLTVVDEREAGKAVSVARAAQSWIRGLS